MPASPDLVAFPLLLMATYGLFRVGRRRPISCLDGFEWVRACSLAILLGVLVAVQVHLALVGSIASPGRLAAALLAVASATGLVGLNAYELWVSFLALKGGARAPSARASVP